MKCFSPFHHELILCQDAFGQLMSVAKIRQKESLLKEGWEEASWLSLTCCVSRRHRLFKFSLVFIQHTTMCTSRGQQSFHVSAILGVTLDFRSSQMNSCSVGWVEHLTVRKLYLKNYTWSCQRKSNIGHYCKESNRRQRAFLSRNPWNIKKQSVHVHAKIGNQPKYSQGGLCGRAMRRKKRRRLGRAGGAQLLALYANSWDQRMWLTLQMSSDPQERWGLQSRRSSTGTLHQITHLTATGGGYGWW
jgi:hypothetical protein